MEEQQTIKYIHELKYPIRERVTLQDLYSIDEAQNKTMKVVRLQNKALPFKNTSKRTSGGTQTQWGSISNERTPAHKAIDVLPANPATTAVHATKCKNNSYAKPGVGKCYWCGEPGHRSNKCPKRRPVNMADYEDEDEDEVQDSDFVEEEGEEATCMIQ